MLLFYLTRFEVSSAPQRRFEGIRVPQNIIRGVETWATPERARRISIVARCGNVAFPVIGKCHKLRTGYVLLALVAWLNGSFALHGSRKLFVSVSSAPVPPEGPLFDGATRTHCDTCTDFAVERIQCAACACHVNNNHGIHQVRVSVAITGLVSFGCTLARPSRTMFHGTLFPEKWPEKRRKNPHRVWFRQIVHPTPITHSLIQRVQHDLLIVVRVCI